MFSKKIKKEKNKFGKQICKSIFAAQKRNGA